MILLEKPILDHFSHINLPNFTSINNIKVITILYLMLSADTLLRVEIRILD
mgnify:CR=1